MEEYSVERIEKKRIINGITEYYLKWKGYPRSENTWEPVDHLYCTDLIAEFERSWMKRSKARNFIDEDIMMNGFDRGLEPNKILGATDMSGNLMFLMSWKNCQKPEFVSSKVANIKCPQLVIKFYEERLTWIDDL